jgi:20S proteasome subunit alpha 6
VRRPTSRSTLSPLPTVRLTSFPHVGLYARVCIIGSLEDLIRHGLHALRETLQQDKELTTNNTAIGIVGSAGVHEGVGTSVDFRILEGPPVEVYLHTMQPKEVPPPASASAPGASASASTPAVPPPATGDEDVQMSE